MSRGRAAVHNWGSKVAMLLGTFQICWQILSENIIFTDKNNFYSKKSCDNTNSTPLCKKCGKIPAILFAVFMA